MEAWSESEGRCGRDGGLDGESNAKTDFFYAHVAIPHP